MPPFNDDLRLGIKLNGMHRLSMQVAEEALFPAAEGEKSHGSCYSYIKAISGLTTIVTPGKHNAGTW